MNTIQSHLIGTWSLVEHSEIDRDPDGVLSYTSDNKMAVHITGKSNEADVFISYSGTFYLDHGYVVHRVEVSDNLNRIGTEQRRYIRMDGNLMTLTESPLETNFKIVWRKQ